MDTEIGKVTFWDEKQGCGTIKLLNGQELYAHRSNVRTDFPRHLDINELVQCRLGQRSRGPVAFEIAPLIPPLPGNGWQIGFRVLGVVGGYNGKRDARYNLILLADGTKLSTAGVPKLYRTGTLVETRIAAAGTFATYNKARDIITAAEKHRWRPDNLQMFENWLLNG